VKDLAMNYQSPGSLYISGKDTDALWLTSKDAKQYID